MKLKDLDLFPSSSIDNKDLIWLSKYESGTEGSSGTYTSYRLDFNQLRSKIGSGTANNTTYLRGDGTWATPSSGGLTKFTEAESTTSPNGTVYVDSLTAAGSSTNVDFAIKPKGTGAILAAIPDSTATGGNKRGSYAVDLQLSRSNSTYVASGNYSFIGGGVDNLVSGNSSACFGNSNTVTSTYTLVGGASNNVSGQYSIVGGLSNTISESHSACGGYGNTITVNSASSAIFGYLNRISVSGGSSAYLGYSLVAGAGAKNCDINGRFVFGVYNTVQGDTQKGLVLLTKRTTDGTTQELFVTGIFRDTNNRLLIANNTAYRFKGSIIGKQSGSTNVGVWDIDGVIVRGTSAGTTTLVVSNVNLVTNSSSWGTPTLTADTTNGALNVNVQGLAGTNIQWTCSLETTEVIYS